MAEPGPDEDRARLRAELGFHRWEAIGHFLSDGDYVGFHRCDYWGAIAEYEKAWELLSTPWQQQTLGADILHGMTVFALRSKDPALADEILAGLRLRAEQIADPSLRAACDKVAKLAARKEEH